MTKDKAKFLVEPASWGIAALTYAVGCFFLISGYMLWMLFIRMLPDDTRG